MGLEWAIAPPECGSGEPNEQFNVVQKVNYLHFAIILAAVVAIVAFGVSLMTEPRRPEQVINRAVDQADTFLKQRAEDCDE